LAVSDLPGLLKQHQDWSIGFARGLYWTPHCLGGVGTGGRWASLSRRPAFPSWVWLGWKGRIQYCSRYGPGSSWGEEELIGVDQIRFDTRFWTSGGGSKLYSVEKLWNPESGTNSIPETSHCLVLEAWVVPFRLQRRSNKDRNILHVCRCHPSTRHEGPLNIHSTQWGWPVFCQHASETEIALRLTQLWDCVLLFQSKSYAGKPSYHFLIVEKFRETYQRVGTLQLKDPHGDFEQLPKERKIIRLE
jgi:hypothetical protein